MPAIPDRWIQYKACGKVIEGTRFICFKVPLSKSIQTGNREIKEIWDIPTLLAKLPNLGAVIDLTNTARYYNPADLKSAGILHKKILTPGRIIPPESSVTEFMNAVDEFLGKGDESLIGFHCTHGLNRTGYMVCRYMRDRLAIPANVAIKKFEKARGYQIERANYIADLLGTSPPPPDLGPHTNIRPVSKEYKSRSRSPLAKEEKCEEQRRDRHSRSSNRYDRYNGNRRKESGYDNKNYNWRDRTSTQTNWRSKEDSRNKSNRRRVSRSSSERSSNSSYDFRYDY